jgi:thiol-disulfide isomerase/thioredoxin
MAHRLARPREPVDAVHRSDVTGEPALAVILDAESGWRRAAVWSKIRVVTNDSMRSVAGNVPATLRACAAALVFASALATGACSRSTPSMAPGGSAAPQARSDAAAPPAPSREAATSAMPSSEASAAGAPPGEVPIGAPLRDAQMNGLNGPSRRLAEFRGRPLVINVWASWCGPCRAETASLERLAWREDSHAFAIIGISTDDYRDRAQAWLRDSNATISHYLDRELEMETMLGASRLPLTVFVDADGRVLARVYGAREWDSAEAVAFMRKTFGLR